MNNFPRHLEQLMADRLDGGLVILLWQTKPLEPGHQVPSQLSDQEPGPVGQELLRRRFLQTEIVLVLFDQILHRATLEKPLHQLFWPPPEVVGDLARWRNLQDSRQKPFGDGRRIAIARSQA